MPIHAYTSHRQLYSTPNAAFIFRCNLFFWGLDFYFSISRFNSGPTFSIHVGTWSKMSFYFQVAYIIGGWYYFHSWCIICVSVLYFRFVACITGLTKSWFRHFYTTNRPAISLLISDNNSHISPTYLPLQLPTKQPISTKSPRTRSSEVGNEPFAELQQQTPTVSRPYGSYKIHYRLSQVLVYYYTAHTYTPVRVIYYITPVIHFTRLHIQLSGT